VSEPKFPVVGPARGTPEYAALEQARMKEDAIRKSIERARKSWRNPAAALAKLRRV
jgi:hypothetical protein